MSKKKLSKHDFKLLQKQKINERYKEKPPQPKQEVIAAYSQGIGFEGITNVLLQCDHDPCTKPEFYEAQREIIPKLEAAAQESMQREYDKLVAGGGFSHDGTFSARRQAKTCLAAALATETKKVIEIAIVSTDPQVSDVVINPKTKSNTLEDIADNLLKQKLKEKNKLDKFSFRTHDRDTNSFRVFADTVDEYLLPDYDDPNHAKATLSSSLDVLSKTHPLGPLKNSIIDRFSFLTNQNSKYTYDELESFWLKTPDEIIQHYLNHKTNKEGINKEECPLLEGWKQFSAQEMKDNLNYALQQTKDFLEKCSHGNTIANEAFNSADKRVAPKRTSWGISFRGRAALAILMWNEPLNWYHIVCQACSIPEVSHQHAKMIDQKLREKFNHNQKEETTSYHIKRDVKKKELSSIKPDPDGHGELHKPWLYNEKDLSDANRNIGIHLYGVFPHYHQGDYLAVTLELLFQTEFGRLVLDNQELFNQSTVLQGLYIVMFFLSREKCVPLQHFQMLFNLFNFDEFNRIHPVHCIQKVIDTITKELKIINSKSMQNDIKQNASDAIEVINNLFMFHFKKEIHCQTCKKITYEQHQQYFILFNSNQDATITELFGNLEQGVESKDYCDDCAKVTDTYEKMMFLSFPKHPIFAYTRFMQDGYLSKNNVDFSSFTYQNNTYSCTHLINFRGSNIKDLHDSGFRLFFRSQHTKQISEVVDSRSFETRETEMPISNRSCLVMMSLKDLFDIPDSLEEKQDHQLKNVHQINPSSLSGKIILAVKDLLENYKFPMTESQIIEYLRENDIELLNLIRQKSTSYLETLLRIHCDVFKRYNSKKKIPGFDLRTVFYGLNSLEYGIDWTEKIPVKRHVKPTTMAPENSKKPGNS